MYSNLQYQPSAITSWEQVLTQCLYHVGLGSGAPADPHLPVTCKSKEFMKMNLIIIPVEENGGGLNTDRTSAATCTIQNNGTKVLYTFTKFEPFYTQLIKT
jgi:hypothetical protein